MNLFSEAELISFGRQIGEKLRQKIAKQTAATQIIELVGDVGAGKTTLTRGIAEGLGVKESITSPSFTISKRYAFLAGKHSATLVHYDFYRLSDPGLMTEDLAESISTPNTVVVIEWGDSVNDILPDNHHVYQISVNDDGSRTVEEATS